RVRHSIACVRIVLATIAKAHIFCHRGAPAGHCSGEMNSTLSNLSDLDLVSHVRAGERNAFAELVRRYQSLICAQAYSVCGDFSRSEDVAQEAFVAAWRQIGEMHDASKLKSWLCTIARRLAMRAAEKGRRPADAHAAPLETAPDLGDPAPSPRDAAVSREESALVWSALDTTPA